MKKIIWIVNVLVAGVLSITNVSAQVGLGTKAGLGGVISATGVLNTEVQTDADISVNSDIIGSSAQTKQYTTFNAAIESSGVESALDEDANYTLFIPTNQAFDKLSSSDKALYLKSKNKAELNTMLKYHIIEGNLSSGDIAIAIRKANGSATFKTLSGDILTASFNAKKNIELVDENGNIALITEFDVKHSNNNTTVHSINNVMTPKK